MIPSQKNLVCKDVHFGKCSLNYYFLFYATIKDNFDTIQKQGLEGKVIQFEYQKFVPFKNPFNIVCDVKPRLANQINEISMEN